MVEDLVQIMVDRWRLPESLVRKFLSENLSELDGSSNLDQLRDAVADLLQSTILESEQ